MHFLRQVALRAASSASRSLTSAPRSSRQFSSRIASTRPAPLSSLYAQRRFASDDVTKEVKNEGEAAVEEAAIESAAPVEESTTETAVAEETAVTEETTTTEETAAAPAVESAAASTVDSATQTAPEQAHPRKLGSTTLYVGNLYFLETEKSVIEFLSQIATPVEFKLIKDVDGRSRGFAFATFASHETCKLVWKELNLREFAGRPIVLRFQNDDKVKPRPTEPTRTVYIKNIDSAVTDRELNELFRPLAKIRDVRVAVNRRTGLPRGFAHADFADVESAVAALKILSKTKLREKLLVCDYSLPAEGSRPAGRTNPIKTPTAE